MDELTEYLVNSSDDGFWDQIQSEARREAEREPVLASFLFASVLGHKKLEDGLGVLLSHKLHTPELPAILLRDLIDDALAGDGTMRASIRADLLAARTQDPAARGYSVQAMSSAIRTWPAWDLRRFESRGWSLLRFHSVPLDGRSSIGPLNNCTS